jgi:hypothetical protein
MPKHLVTILEMNDDLVMALHAAYDDTDTASREKTGQRALFHKAVDRHLDRVVEILRECGFVRGSTKKQRRKIDVDTWNRLAEAERKVDVSRPALLRACLRLELLRRKRAPGSRRK